MNERENKSEEIYMQPVPRKQYTTQTTRPDGEIVPWMSAYGPLAYCPENPPETDELFDYINVMPDAFKWKNPYNNYIFGEDRVSPLYSSEPIIEFWEAARKSAVKRVYVSNGKHQDQRFMAPIAVYRTDHYPYQDCRILIQNGSYLTCRCQDQRFIDEGKIIIYRGVRDAPEFNWLDIDIDNLSERDRATWLAYIAVQAGCFFDSEYAFVCAHDLIGLNSTYHISFPDVLVHARNAFGFESDEGFGEELLWASRQHFTLNPRLASSKFGPNWIKAITPVTNIRLTSFFTQEYEVRIIDPTLVQIVETSGCKVMKIER